MTDRILEDLVPTYDKKKVGNTIKQSSIMRSMFQGFSLETGPDGDTLYIFNPEGPPEYRDSIFIIEVYYEGRPHFLCALNIYDTYLGKVFPYLLNAIEYARTLVNNEELLALLHRPRPDRILTDEQKAIRDRKLAQIKERFKAKQEKLLFDRAAAKQLRAERKHTLAEAQAVADTAVAAATTTATEPEPTV